MNAKLLKAPFWSLHYEFAPLEISAKDVALAAVAAVDRSTPQVDNITKCRPPLFFILHRAFSPPGQRVRADFLERSQSVGHEARRRRGETVDDPFADFDLAVRRASLRPGNTRHSTLGTPDSQASSSSPTGRATIATTEEAHKVSTPPPAGSSPFAPSSPAEQTPPPAANDSASRGSPLKESTTAREVEEAEQSEPADADTSGSSQPQSGIPVIVSETEATQQAQRPSPITSSESGSGQSAANASSDSNNADETESKTESASPPPATTIEKPAATSTSTSQSEAAPQAQPAPAAGGLGASLGVRGPMVGRPSMAVTPGYVADIKEKFQSGGGNAGDNTTITANDDVVDPSPTLTPTPEGAAKRSRGPKRASAMPAVSVAEMTRRFEGGDGTTEGDAVPAGTVAVSGFYTQSEAEPKSADTPAEPAPAPGLAPQPASEERAEKPKPAPSAAPMMMIQVTRASVVEREVPRGGDTSPAASGDNKGEQDAQKDADSNAETKAESNAESNADSNAEPPATSGGLEPTASSTGDAAEKEEENPPPPALPDHWK